MRRSPRSYSNEHLRASSVYPRTPIFLSQRRTDAKISVRIISEPISKLFGPTLPLKIGIARRSAQGMVVPCTSAGTQQTRFSGGKPESWRPFSHISALLVVHLANALQHSSRLELYENGRPPAWTRIILRWVLITITYFFALRSLRLGENYSFWMDAS